MENHEDEEVLRIILFRLDFVEAIKYFEAAKLASNDFIRDGLLKVGIITYAKPFMKNTGVHKEVKNYRLPKNIVLDEFQWLHEMFMDYRGNFIGHSNFKTIKPNISPLTKTPKGDMHSIQYTDISFDHWFNKDNEFPNETLLIDQAIELANTLIADIPAPHTTEEVFNGSSNA